MASVVAQDTFTHEEFEKLRDFFYRKTGIFFEDTKRYFVDKRVCERMAVTRLNFRSYFTLIRFQASGAELEQLTNLMTVNETYFFREDYQMKCMTSGLLPEILKEKRTNRALRIWSIPSSTGEEPYTIAMHLLEYWPEVNNHAVEIVASDIDSAALKKAALGVYGARSLQYVPKNLLRKYFIPNSKGEYQICEDLRSSIDFHPANLNDAQQPRIFSGFDIIFCRNLLIYYDELSRRRAAETLYEALNPGGFLCLGHSESMSRISSLFEIRKFPDAIVYQRPTAKVRGEAS